MSISSLYTTNQYVTFLISDTIIALSRTERSDQRQYQLVSIMFRWGIDFAGPLPETDRGNEYVLVCIEHCTKWIELIPLPTKSCANIARAFF